MGKVVDALIKGDPLGKLAWDAVGVDAWWEISVGKYIREALIPTPDDDFGNEAMAQQQMLRSPTEARRSIYGKAMVSGPIVFAEESGTDNEFLHLVIPLAAHRCTEVLEIYFDDERVYSGGSLDAEYSDHARINIHLGDQTAADSDLVSECDNWTAEHLGLGITYLYVRLKYDPEFFASGLPNIKALVKGKQIYDPRKDSTVGGSGSHRWDDDSTWEWSDNWALCVLDYTRFESGVGALASEIDLPSYALAANDSDEPVEYDDEGNSEPRYTCNGTFTQSMTPVSVLDKLLTAGAGMQTYCSGRYQLFSGVYQGPYVLSLGEADLAGEVELRPFTPRAALCNAVRGTFVDPDNFYQPTDFAPYESAYYRGQDNDEYIDQDIDLPFTQSTYTAQRLAKLYLELNRAGQQISVPLNMIGLSISVGQVVELDLPRLGIKAEYQVMDWSFDFGQPVKVTLRETTASLFDYDKGSYTSRKLTPVLNLPSPTRVPTPTGAVWTAMGDDANWQGVLTWDAPGGNSAYRYRLEVSNSSDVVVYQANIDGTRHHIPKLDAGNYTITLWAVNLFANRSNVPATIAIGASVPPPVTGLVVEVGSLSLTVTPQTAAATAQSTSFEVYGAQTNVFADALLVGSGKTVVWAERQPATQYYLWARTVNNYGVGEWFGPTLVTTAQDSTPILDLIMDDLVIEENHLTESLRDRIDLVDQPGGLTEQVGNIASDYIDSSALMVALGSYATQDLLAQSLSDYVTGDSLLLTLEDYITDTDLGSVLGGYVTTSALANEDFAKNSSLTAYVQQTDLNVTLNSYVTNTELANADYATNTSLTAYVQQDDLNATLNSYVTNTELANADYATNTALTAYVQQTDLNTTLGSYVTTTALANADYAKNSSLTAYVQQDDLDVTLNSYVTQTELASADYATNTSLTAYVQQDDLDVTLNSYVTQTELASADYATNTSLTAYVQQDDLNATLNSYVTNTELANADYATNTALTAYVQQTDLNTTLGSYVTTTALANADYAKNSSLTAYVQQDDLDVTLNSYVTQTELASADYATNTSLTAYVQQDDLDVTLNSYVTQTELASADYATNTSLTAYVLETDLTSTLNSYVTTTALANADYATNTDLTAYVLQTDLDTRLSSYVTSTQLANEQFAKSSDLTAYVTTSSLGTTLSSYVTNTALASADYATNSSLTSYATKASVTAVEQRMTANENEAFYSLKVDANGRVAGIGLLANPDETAIYFNADKFIVLPPDSDDATESVSPFIIDATTGKTVIADALVRNLTAANFVGGSITADSLAVTQYVNLPTSSIAEDMLDVSFLNSLARIDPSAVTTGGTKTGSGTCVSRTITLGAIASGGLTTKLRVYMGGVFSTGLGTKPSAPSVTVAIKRDSTTLDTQVFSGSVIQPPGDPWELHFGAINWEFSDLATTQGQNHVYSAVITVADASSLLSAATLSFTATEPVGSSGGIVIQTLASNSVNYFTVGGQGASVLNGDLHVNNFATKIASSTGVLYDQGTAVSSKFAALSHTHSGYAATSHTHSEYALTSHTHTAADVGALPLTGNAASATKLQTPRTISGVSFDGSANISLTASDVGALPISGGTLTGTVTASGSNPIAFGTGNQNLMRVNSAVMGSTWFSQRSSGNGVTGWSWDYYDSYSAMHLTASTGNLSVMGAIVGGRIYTGYDSGIANSVNCSNWFRSSGATGWYNGTYGGGIYMTDTTFVRVYGGKDFLCEGQSHSYYSGKGAALANIGYIGAFRANHPDHARANGTQYYPSFASNSKADNGYRQHLSMGHKRTNSGWDYAYIAFGGNDGYPTKEWLFDTNGAIICPGDVYATGNVKGYQTSDWNVKRNFTPFENALDKVCSWRTGYYEKMTFEDGKHTGWESESGVIAQDIEATIDHVVTENNMQHKTIKQGGHELVAMMAAAIKELRAEVAELRGRLN
ncbi:tail fiber domain-containing protein [Shewanella sp. AS1]|uniref:phage tail tip protein J-related protein n=1 Tax=Shewanella sp. AS1 TaxID=2907626 RepID=UPI001F3F1BCE|nr:tail fiber domain-containing protein [Shewanella sp. AS1]MCE9679623.1 tail fiber domain-containing protein [Shewanella sp. AS1]